MTKEEFFKSYLTDPLLYEKRMISVEKAEQLKFSESSGVPLLEVIKMAITGNIGQEQEGATGRKINQYLLNSKS
jgi:signal transduction protein with GAF and PtsI domain